MYGPAQKTGVEKWGVLYLKVESNDVKYIPEYSPTHFVTPSILYLNIFKMFRLFFVWKQMFDVKKKAGHVWALNFSIVDCLIYYCTGIYI